VWDTESGLISETYVIPPDKYDAFKLDKANPGAYATSTYTYSQGRTTSQTSCSSCATSAKLSYSYEWTAENFHSLLQKPISGYDYTNSANTPSIQIETRRNEDGRDLLVSIRQMNANGRTLAYLTRTGNIQGLLKQNLFY